MTWKIHMSSLGQLFYLNPNSFLSFPKSKLWKCHFCEIILIHNLGTVVTLVEKWQKIKQISSWIMEGFNNQNWFQVSYYTASTTERNWCCSKSNALGFYCLLWANRRQYSWRRSCKNFAGFETVMWITGSIPERWGMNSGADNLHRGACRLSCVLQCVFVCLF